MYLAIVDTETTGVDDDSVAIEKAVILYHLKHGIVAQASTLLYADGLSQDVECLTGIPPEMLRIAPRSLPQYFDELLNASSAIVAHNASFDKKYWTTPPGTPWLCTIEDFELKTSTGKQALINIALFYGVPITSAHRAQTDCQLIAQVFDKLRDRGELEAFVSHAFERAKSPTVLIRLLDTHYNDKDTIKNWRCKSGGRFFWNPEQRIWEGQFKQIDLISATLPHPAYTTEEVASC